MMDTRYNTSKVTYSEQGPSASAQPSLHEWRMGIEDVLNGACLINGDGPDQG